MAAMCFAAVLTSLSMGTALFGGFMVPGALGAELLSLALAMTTAIAVASASALDS